MNENEKRTEQRDPGEAAGDGKAAHGYRNEVSWDGGRGRQPYANQGPEEQGPAAGRGYEGGSAGDAAGRNQEQLEAVKRKPDPPLRESPRKPHGRDLDHAEQREQQHDGDGNAEKPEDDGHGGKTP